MKVVVEIKGSLKIVNLNRRKAIRERCLNCSACYLVEVTNCEFTECALFPFRSGQGKQNAKDRSKAIRDYCLLGITRDTLAGIRRRNAISYRRITKTKILYHIDDITEYLKYGKVNARFLSEYSFCTSLYQL